MFFKKRSVSGDKEGCGNKKKIEGLHSLSRMKREPVPGIIAALLP
jgi:hypothetical protein